MIDRRRFLAGAAAAGLTLGGSGADGNPVAPRFQRLGLPPSSEARLHFVPLQQTIGDFVATRAAMNAAHSSYPNPAITDTVDNGINEFIFVTHRGSYLIPPRAQRSYPLLPGREPALA